MKKILGLALLAMVLTGCAGMNWFTKPDNQQTLVNMGLTCWAGPDVKAGAAYIIKKEGTSVEPTTTGEFLIGCGDKWYSVICDFTKKPSENPCSDMKEYELKPPMVEGIPVEEVPGPEA